jgi:hypothetical protein
MASGDGPQRPPRRDELSAVPGEDVDTWARRVRAKAVVDPVLLDEERARQNKARSQFTKRSQQRVRDTVRWLIASLLALVLFVILNQAAGLSGWLIAASVVAVIASAGTVARASQLKRSGDPAAITSGPALDRNQIVRLTELDDPCQLLLKRARQAIAESHSSLDSLGNQVDRDKADDMLRTGEWDLALVLRQVTRLRAKYDADPATRPDDARRALETAHEQAVPGHGQRQPAERRRADSYRHDRGSRRPSYRANQGIHGKRDPDSTAYRRKDGGIEGPHHG